MPIPVTCECGRSMRVKDEVAGRKFRCPSCSRVLAVPDPQVEDLDFVMTAEPVEEESSPRRQRPERGVTASPRPQPRRDPDEDDEDERPRRPRSRRDEEDEDDRPRRRRREEEEDEEDERPSRRIRQGSGRMEDARSLRRKKPRVEVNEGWFGSINAGVIGGLLMMLIAVVWFVLGLMGGIIFFYPPILFVIGLIAFIGGLVKGE
jgi:hypothetical protein